MSHFERSQKSDIKRSFGRTATGQSTTVGREPAQASLDHPRYGRRRRSRYANTRRQDAAAAAATAQISIAVSRHPRRLTVINKRYVREKRKRYGAESRDRRARTGRSESAVPLPLTRSLSRHGTRIRRKLLMQTARGRAGAGSAMIARCTYSTRA